MYYINVYKNDLILCNFDLKIFIKNIRFKE